MRRRLRDFSIRLVVIAAILLCLGRVYGTALVTPMLPALAWVIETVDDRLRVEQVTIVTSRAESLIALKVTPVRMLMFGNRVLMPDARAHFTPATLLGSILQPVILFLAIILAWPVAGWPAGAVRLLLALPTVALLLVVNVPLGFVGVMEDYREYAKGIPVAPLVYWNDFLQTGGPLVLAVALGVLVVSAADGVWRSLIVAATPSR